MSKNNQRNVTKHNVTKGRLVTVLKMNEEKKYFPCPLCKEKLLVKYTFKSKPYCICESCGVQLFVRNQTGIKKFKKLFLTWIDILIRIYMLM